MRHDKRRGEREVSFPSMRHELQYAVLALADEEFQESVWVDNVTPSAQFSYSLDSAFHALMDDSIVADEDAAAIGTVLANEQELASVEELVDVARRLISEIGLSGTFEDARSSNSWAERRSCGKEGKGRAG
jgi:hypothetical protein